LEKGEAVLSFYAWDAIYRLYILLINNDIMNTKRNGFFMAALAMVLFAMNLDANNIQVSNTRLIGQNTSAGVNNPANYTLVQFDLSWENSWRTDDLNGDGVTNLDAAWVCVKYRIGSGDWQHAWLNNDGHSGGTGTGATIDAGLLTPGNAFHATTNPGLGVFIYRSANGTGTFSIGGAQLRWNYGANGVADNSNIELRVFAIEMVYVPQGSFYLGSGGSEDNAFYKYPTTTNPYQVTSENAITVGTETDNLYYTSTTYGGDHSGPIPVGFPKGYNAFYMMKYSITQQQYVDFLNTLTRTQQDNRTETSLAAGITTVSNRYVMSNNNVLQYRNGIRCDESIHSSDPITFYCDLNGDGTGGQTADGQWIACNQLSWMDGAAYTDWAGLRPMTELEYEKACRGTVTPVSNEYAWGTATVADNAYSLSNAGAANEGIATNYSTAANTGNASYSATYSNIDGPLRVGIFAANTSNTGRITAGAGYYGIMELSGNLREWPVTIGNATGRAFTGVHGNGALSDAGHADVFAWPGLNSGQVTGAYGSGLRGGAWSAPADNLRTSDRRFAADIFTNRYDSFGFRGVRSVP
jgi:formylglycine-generating enzyme required for sulfatase activity